MCEPLKAAVRDRQAVVGPLHKRVLFFLCCNQAASSSTKSVPYFFSSPVSSQSTDLPNSRLRAFAYQESQIHRVLWSAVGKSGNLAQAEQALIRGNECQAEHFGGGR